MTALHALRLRNGFALAVAACIALLLAAVLIKVPLLAVGAVAALVLGLTLGVESLIVTCLLGATGLLPFTHADNAVGPEIKVYAFFFLLAMGLMLAVYISRGLAGKKGWPVPTNMLSIGLVALLSYVVVTALGSQPQEVPALTAPFLILPLSGISVILWLSHEEALKGLQRALPLVVVLVAAWAFAYDAGAAGCGPCREWVSTGVTNTGLLGPGSRLYTAGQNTMLGLFLISFAYMLARPRPLTIGLVSLGLITIALQGSRAQYIAVAAGMFVLLVWKMGQLRVGGRVVLAVITALAVVAVLNSPVGHKAISAYTETNQGTGTGTYRLQLIDKASESWTLLGQGFSTHTLELGFDVDLGLPNTLLVLGYVGAVLQLALICMGIWRGMAAHSLVGTTIASILLMVLVVRPSLPLLEYGHSAVFYGAVLGLAALIQLARRKDWARSLAPVT